ncbi:MAG: M23 family metallopeptidase [Trueperaceae bacterium]
MAFWRTLRPGWYLLLAAVVYGVVVTVLLAGQRSELRELRQRSDAPPAAQPPAAAQSSDDRGLWFPIPGAELPDNPAHLPGSPRPYRQGASEGFDFYDGDSGVPVPYGAAVIAAAAGTLVRVDNAFREADEGEWQRLMSAVADGADDDELDRLRGRQVWLEIEDGRLLRYAHLSAIRDGLSEGQPVQRGTVIGFVGNSGTDEGVAGTRRGSRLHFEIWGDDGYFGEGMDADEVHIAAATVFTGP